MPRGLACGPLQVSFQRFARPIGGRIAGVPRSLGALPLATYGDGFLLPVGPDEAFWIGLSMPFGTVPDRLRPAALQVVARGHDGTVRRSGALPVASTRVFTGFPDQDGVSVLDAAIAVLVLDEGATARIELVGPAAFTAHTGIAAPPLDPAAGYGGWRLP